MLKVDSPFWILSISFVNLPFYSMEIRHCLVKHFKMIIGEVGPVEIELVFTLIFVVSGGILGLSIYDIPIS